MVVIIRLVLFALFCCGILVAAVYFFQDRLLYFPSSEIACTPDALGLDFEDVNFQAGTARPCMAGMFRPLRPPPRFCSVTAMPVIFPSA